MQRKAFSVLDPVVLAGSLLVASGLFHLLWMWGTNAEWSGPLSPRKPGLFGVSGGLTIWSIGWALKQCRPYPYDRLFARMMASALLAEVGLITLQYWRGVPSHFSRSTTLDVCIEITMMVLIFLVTLGLAWLCTRSFRLVRMPQARAIAIRAGLWLLLISCGLGIVTSFLGELNLEKGRSPEIWGRAGVLKFPHGVALHAIQTLPIVAALLQWLRVSNAKWIVLQVAAAHVFFLGYAIWQTLNGRSRFDVDLEGGVLLLVSVSLLLIPCAMIGYDLVARNFQSKSTT